MLQGTKTFERFSGFVDTFIIFNGADAASHIYPIQNRRRVFSTISEIAENSVLSYTRFTAW